MAGSADLSLAARIGTNTWLRSDGGEPLGSLDPPRSTSRSDLVAEGQGVRHQACVLPVHIGQRVTRFQGSTRGHDRFVASWLGRIGSRRTTPSASPPWSVARFWRKPTIAINRPKGSGHNQSNSTITRIRIATASQQQRSPVDSLRSTFWLIPRDATVVPHARVLWLPKTRPSSE